MAADGESAAIVWAPYGYGDACVTSVWHPRTGKLVRLGPPPPAGQACDTTARRVGLAYANGRAAWFESVGSITVNTALYTATLTRPAVRDVLASSTRGAGAADNCAGPDIGQGLVGRGRLIVFTTLTYGRCASPPSQDTFSVVDQTIWRVAARGGSACPLHDATGSTPTCVNVTKAKGPLVPLDIDGGRIAVLRGTSTIELLDQNGQTLREVTPTATPLAAALSGQSLAVLVQRALEVYNTETGALMQSWPLPDVPGGGHAARLRLIAASRGLALYLLDGKAHLLRLRDGRDATIDRADAADLTTQGLFYANGVRGVRFVPYAKLPLKGE